MTNISSRLGAFGGPMVEILDLARWAPSGDNTQPWRFAPISPTHVRVHGFDTRDHCVYDLDGRASRLSIGALIETLSVAARSFGMRASIERDRGAPETAPVFDVRLESAPSLAPDPLVAVIRERSVQRRALSTRPLTGEEKRALEAAVGPDHELAWLEGFDRRWAMASLMFRSARIRLTIEEAYRVHASVIEWHATRSADRMPDAALGLDPVSLAAMRWVMRSWPVTRFVSRYLGGTLAPRLQLDLLPGLRCAAHLAIATKRAVPVDQRLDADFAAGRAIQRFWLTAEQLGLRHQPEMTPLIFSRYAEEHRRFTTDEAAIRLADAVCGRLDAILGRDLLARTLWLGRIGAGPAAEARSVRLPLESLIVAQPGDSGRGEQAIRASSGNPS